MNRAATRAVVRFISPPFGKSGKHRKEEFNLKGGWRVDPEQPGFGFSWIAPAMRCGALEIEAVAGLHTVVFIRVQPNFKFAAEDVQKFLAFVGIGFAAAAARLDTKQMRLHGGVAPGEKFHAHAFGGFEDFAFSGLDQFGIVLCRFEEGKNIGAIVARDAAQRADGSAHLAAFESAEKTNGNAGGASNLREEKITALAQTAKTEPRRSGIFGGRNNSLFLEDVNDRGGIQSAGSAKEDGAFQQAYVRFAVKTVTAARALRRDEAERFPGAQRGGRNTD